MRSVGQRSSAFVGGPKSRRDRMTCIAGYTDGQTIVIGADSLTTAGCEALSLAEPKVWTANDHILIGGAGTPHVLQIARYDIDPPVFSDSVMQGLHRWVTAFRARCKALDRDLDSKDAAGAWFLMAIRGRFYEVQGNGSVISMVGGFATTGCGGAEARAAMWALSQFRDSWPAQEIVDLALRASAAYNTHVRAPFHFVSMDVKAW